MKLDETQWPNFDQMLMTNFRIFKITKVLNVTKRVWAKLSNCSANFNSKWVKKKTAQHFLVWKPNKVKLTNFQPIFNQKEKKRVSDSLKLETKVKVTNF